MYLIFLWTNVELRVASTADDGGVTGPAQQQVFADCMDDYKANIEHCKKSFLGDLPGLSRCIDFVVQMAENCLVM